MIEPKEKFMKIAIEQAIKAKNDGDYAVGAVIVQSDKIIAMAGNRSKIDQDPIHHAEIIAIKEAAKVLGKRHLDDCILYTTHEPCPMCATASVWAKMKGIIYGAKIEDMREYRIRNGSNEWSWRTIDIPAAHVLEKGEPRLILIGEFMREKCKSLFHS